MHPDRLLSLVFALSLAMPACGDDEPGTDGPTGGDPPADPTLTQPASPTAAVRFKGNEVLANDLGQALALEPEAICTELGSFSCTDEVHAVTLGGVSPYDKQIYEPVRRTTSTTPLAAERVVLSACLERARRDFANPAAASTFVALPLEGGRLVDPAADTVTQAIDRLYVGLVARHASTGEIAAVRDFYPAVEASGDAKPAETWAALACFAIGTSVEALFY